MGELVVMTSVQTRNEELAHRALVPELKIRNLCSQSGQFVARVL